ncbi:MAG: DUF4097 family beta strand repeat-containing protein [Bacilli bacterium]
MLSKILKFLGLAMLFGIVISLVGVFALGGDIKSVATHFNDDGSYTFIKQEGTETITEINITAINRSVEVVLSSDDSWHLEYFNSEKDSFNYNYTEGRLILDNITKRQIFTIFKWTSSHIRLVKLFLPASFSGNIYIETTNGNIKVENISLINMVDLETTNGSLTLRDVYVENDATMNTTNGTISVVNSRIDKKLSAETTNGNINLTSVMTLDADCATTNGTVRVSIIGNSDDFRISVRTTNGKIYFEDMVLASQTLNPSKSNVIKLNTTNGNIYIEFIE